MKKIVSLILALALCLALAAPALAAEYTYTNANDVTITVDAVKVETAPITFAAEDPSFVPDPVEVTLITVTPDTVISVKNSAGESAEMWFYPYFYSEDRGGYRDSGLGSTFYDGDTFEMKTHGEGGYHYTLFSGDDYYFLVDADATAPTEDTSPEDATTAAPETTTPTTTPVEGGVVYTVKQYDTMGKIALNYYGSYGYHNALYKANSDAFAKTGGRLNTGMTLTLPDTLAGKARFAEQTLAEGESFYTVKAGDTLGAIAIATYGDVMEYVAIYERNADRLKDANTIFEGQVIVLPAKEDT